MIDKIRFGLMSPEMVKKMSVVEITRPELYDRDGYPIENGVMDSRLGVIDPGLRCRTCGGNIGKCMGHFGYLELAKPVVNVNYVKEIHQILTATCQNCAKPLGELKGKDPLKSLYLSKKSECPHCGARQDKVTVEKPHSFKIGRESINPQDIREWFEKIPLSSAKKFGLKGGRPEWLIITLFPIPPVTMRPSITLEIGERSEDDLTHKIVDIVRANQRLRDSIDIGAPDFIQEDQWELLQYHISSFFNNELSGVPQARHRSGRPLRTIAQRLKGKEGRFRMNLSGKRVNFSARTVISPDPNISINEVGVPEEIAKDLTIPVKVNEKNINKIRSLIRKGPNRWPGANYVIRPDGLRKKITDGNRNSIVDEIEPKFIVERHLQNGDIGIFNRQPSLHRMSMMAHKVRVMPHKTFRLNLCVCPPYNADFDGDEMNLHIPQTEEAQTEAKELMLVEKQIRSPRFGGPIIGCIQDHISGNYLLTKKGNKINKKDAIQLMVDSGIAVKNMDKDIDGKKVFSYLLPDDLNIEFKSNVCRGCDECKKEECPYDEYVKIENGKLKAGVIDKQAIAEEDGKLLDKIERYYGSEASKKFLNSVSKLGINYLDIHGFTVGISDVDISKKARKEIDRVINKNQKRADDLVERYRKGELERRPGENIKESLESYILNVLKEILDEVGEIVSGDIKENHAIAMAKTGARGSMVNLTQLAGVVGQQTLQSKRIHRGYYGRTLPHFKRGELSPKAHGFVSSSFKRGLTPYEFFFNSMDSREKLMDTSLRTRQSGYMERRLVNALQELRVEYDNTIRDNTGTIIQFKPGEDGIDPAKSEWGKIDVEKIVKELIG